MGLFRWGFYEYNGNVDAYASGGLGYLRMRQALAVKLTDMPETLTHMPSDVWNIYEYARMCV